MISSGPTVIKASKSSPSRASFSASQTPQRFPGFRHKFRLLAAHFRRTRPARRPDRLCSPNRSSDARSPEKLEIRSIALKHRQPRQCKKESSRTGAFQFDHISGPTSDRPFVDLCFCRGRRGLRYDRPADRFSCFYYLGLVGFAGAKHFATPRRSRSSVSFSVSLLLMKRPPHFLRTPIGINRFLTRSTRKSIAQQGSAVAAHVVSRV